MNNHASGKTLRYFFCIFALCAFGYAAQVGDFVSYTQSGNQVDIEVSNGAVRIIVCDTNVFRVSFDTRSTNRFTAVQGGGTGNCKDVLWMADLNSRTFPDPGTTVTEDSATLNVATSALICKVQKTPFRVYWYKSDGITEITRDSAAMNNTGSSSGSPALTFYPARTSTITGGERQWSTT